MKTVLVKLSAPNKDKDQLIAELDRALSSNLFFISERTNLLKSILNEINLVNKEIDFKVNPKMQKIRNLLLTSIEQGEVWKEFQLHFKKVHPNFFKKLTSYSNELTQGDLRIAAYIKLGMSTKEVAQLRGVSPKSIEMSFYRLKKKMHLSASDSLKRYIADI